MLDMTAQTAGFQRARGRARVALSSEGRLSDLAQSGCAKAFLPRIPSSIPEVVFLNTAGGLTGGDELSFSLSVGEGARAVGTTQTAERAYASPGDAARVTVDLQVGDGGRLDWLPQETILFETSSLKRVTRAELSGSAEFLGLEILVLGRAAMGETLGNAELLDRREIVRDGLPLVTEPVALDASLLGAPNRAATLAGQRAFATLVFAAQGSEDSLGPVRALLPDTGPVVAGASAWDGRLILRMMAPDAWPLRQALLPVMAQLRDGAPAPRVWQ